MLTIPVKDITKDGLEWKETLTGSTLFPEEEELHFTQAIEVSALISKMGEKVFVTGVLGTEVQLTCSRCLDDFSYPLRVKFELFYLPVSISGRVEEHKELKPEDFQISFYTGNTIDLGEESRQHLLLALPVKPLCFTNCKGLCSQCGQNLNQGECKCHKQEKGSSFTALKDLVKWLKQDRRSQN